MFECLAFHAKIDFKLMDITVIIPAYNIANFISEAVESALRQDPPFTKIIVVDDGSIDGTGKAVSKFNNSRIFYHYQSNQGLGPARNIGLDFATSEYVCFLDGDDLLEPDLTSSFNTELARNPDLDLYAFSALDFEHGSGKLLPSCDYMLRKNPGYFKSGRDAMIDGLMCGSFPSCAYMYIFRRSAIEGVRRLRFMNITHEDEVFTPELFMNCSATIVSPRLYYRRRVRPNSIMTTPANINNVTGMLQATRWWIAQCRNSVSQDETRLFRRQAYHFYSRAILYASRSHLQLTQIKSLVGQHAPEMLHMVRLDHAVSRFSRKLATHFIELRSKVGLTTWRPRW